MTKKLNGGRLLNVGHLPLNALSTRIFPCIDRLLYIGLIIIIMSLYDYFYVNMTLYIPMLWYVHLIFRSFLFAAPENRESRPSGSRISYKTTDRQYDKVSLVF
jgi:hypothetical protein